MNKKTETLKTIQKALKIFVGVSMIYNITPITEMNSGTHT